MAVALLNHAAGVWLRAGNVSRGSKRRTGIASKLDMVAEGQRLEDGVSSGHTGKGMIFFYNHLGGLKMYNWKNIRFKKTVITLYITFGLLGVTWILRNVLGEFADVTPADIRTFFISCVSIAAVILLIPYMIVKCNPEKDYTYKDLFSAF